MVHAQASESSRAAPVPTRSPHTSPHRPLEQRRGGSGNSGAPPRPGFPPPGGARGPRAPGSGEAQAGRRGAGGARLRSVRPSGSPGCVLGVPSASREGDSATRSRIEKLRETENEGREGAGASSPSNRAAVRICPGLVWNLRPRPPPLRNWRREGRGGEGRAALQLQCRGHAMRGREQRQERRVPRGSWGADLILLFHSLPSPTLQKGSESRLWRLEDAGW